MCDAPGFAFACIFMVFVEHLQLGAGGGVDRGCILEPVAENGVLGTAPKSFLFLLSDWSRAY